MTSGTSRVHEMRPKRQEHVLQQLCWACFRISAMEPPIVAAAPASSSMLKVAIVIYFSREKRLETLGVSASTTTRISQQTGLKGQCMSAMDCGLL